MGKTITLCEVYSFSTSANLLINEVAPVVDTRLARREEGGGEQTTESAEHKPIMEVGSSGKAYPLFSVYTKCALLEVACATLKRKMSNIKFVR